MLDSATAGSSGRPNSNTPRPKISKLKILLWLIVLIILAGGIFLGARAWGLVKKILDEKGSAVFSFRQLFLGGDRTLKHEENGEVRFLLMGIGGENHDGGTLTDTMILATLRLPRTKNDLPKVGLISIPRDLAADIAGYGIRKINSAYAYGGAELAVKTVEDALNVKIPYYGVVDFAGFKKAIDDLGGMEIFVETGFTDSQFPDEKGGYLEPLAFEPGLQKMDGTRALQYVRSRHGNNNQGTDFARSRRQQELLKALKNKILSRESLKNFGALNRALESLAEHLHTNLEPHEFLRLYGLAKDIENERIYSLSLNHEGGILCDQIDEETKAYLLVPCLGPGDFSAIRSLVQNQFLIAPLGREQAVIEIQNASGDNTLALRAEKLLKSPGVTLLHGAFRAEAQYQETVIYDNTRDQKPQTLNYLKTRLPQARVAQSPFPFPVSNPVPPDFVIILASSL